MKIKNTIVKYFLILITTVLLSGCLNSESAIQTAIAKTEAAKPTYTLTHTSSPTFTPIPTSTSTSTSTLTPTLTNTPTDTPIPVENQTQTAIAEISTGTAEAIRATQSASDARATSTQKAYEISLTATASSRPSSLTFTEIESKYYELDDDPWNEYRISLKGINVQWSGKVLDKTFDTLILDLGQYAPDRLIALHQVPTITVDKYNIGDYVSFIAKITDVTFYCDVQLNLIDMK